MVVEYAIGIREPNLPQLPVPQVPCHAIFRNDLYFDCAWHNATFFWVVISESAFATHCSIGLESSANCNCSNK